MGVESGCCVFETTIESEYSMSENHLLIYFTAKKKQIDQLRNILKHLGFANEKISWNYPLRTKEFAVIIEYDATNEQIEKADSIFKYIQVNGGKIE